MPLPVLHLQPPNLISSPITLRLNKLRPSTIQFDVTLPEYSILLTPPFYPPFSCPFLPYYHRRNAILNSHRDPVTTSVSLFKDPETILVLFPGKNNVIPYRLTLTCYVVIKVLKRLCRFTYIIIIITVFLPADPTSIQHHKNLLCLPKKTFLSRM